MIQWSKEKRCCTSMKNAPTCQQRAATSQRPRPPRPPRPPTRFGARDQQTNRLWDACRRLETRRCAAVKHARGPTSELALGHGLASVLYHPRPSIHRHMYREQIFALHPSPPRVRDEVDRGTRSNAAAVAHSHGHGHEAVVGALGENGMPVCSLSSRSSACNCA